MTELEQGGATTNAVDTQSQMHRVRASAQTTPQQSVGEGAETTHDPAPASTTGARSEEHHARFSTQTTQQQSISECAEATHGPAPASTVGARSEERRVRFSTQATLRQSTSGCAAKPALGTSVEWVVPFHDLDPMDICWHGNYVRYFEYARTALLQRLDYDYPQMRDSGYAWPVIELNIRYARPLVYQQRIVITAAIVEWENRLKIRYEIRDMASNKRLTHGYTVQVAVAMATHEMCFVSPPVLFEKLGVAQP